MEYICHLYVSSFEGKNNYLPLPSCRFIIIWLLCFRFLVAFFMCTTSLKGSVPPCFVISNRSPSAPVFCSCVYLTPSCQVTWVLVYLAIHKVARKIECHSVRVPLIYSCIYIHAHFDFFSIYLINEVYFQA